MSKQNTEKPTPKGSIKFSISLSEEQKVAKQAILHHPYNFIVGKAGSGKTMLACQVALDMFFKRMINKIIIHALLFQPKIMDSYQVLKKKKWNLG